MPHILSYTPAWLSHPSPGFDLFASPVNEAGQKSASTALQDVGALHKGPRRAIAKRGAEVFVASGNTIRWADLSMLKDDWEEKKAQRQRGSKEFRERSQTPYDDPLEGLRHKVLKVAVHEPIQQLIPSPNRDLIAIVTSHTVHIAIIPDSNHLDQPDSGPLKVRTYTLGPTTHVLSQSPVVSALWHPLSATGECIVTVTSDAVVRLWELDRKNRASFDQPTIDLDLAKLHHATSVKDDIKSSPLNSNRGYSVDRIGMEAAAATFGGSGSNAEHGWAPMTLWIAMTEGDVYTLCPLLPSKWRSPSAVIPSLTTAVLAKKSYAEGPDSHEEQQRIFEAQFQWLLDLDEQDPIMYIGQDTVGNEWRMPVYSRPTVPSAIPRLQGPFRIMPGDQEDDLELSDIHVVPAKLDTDELLADGEEGFIDDGSEGLSATVVCLSSTGGRIYVTLCLEDVEGKWLPLQKSRTQQHVDPDAQPELTLLEALDTMRTVSVPEPSEWPTFSADLASRYAFYVNHSQGTYYLSLDPWLTVLERELQSDEPTGASFRMAVLSRGAGTERERVVRFERSPGDTSSSVPSAAVLFDDSDLGYLLLTTDGSRPYAVELGQLNDIGTVGAKKQTINSLAETSHSPTVEPESPQLVLPPPPPRQSFQAPPIFTSHQTVLRDYMATKVPARHRHALRDEIRLSTATLDVLTGAHRTVAGETHSLEAAAAEVFRRCERLLNELRAQVRRANETAGRVERVLGEDVDYEESDEDESDQDDDSARDGQQALRGSKKLEARLKRAAAKNEELAARHERVRRRLAAVAARPLSENEAAWAAEVQRLRGAIGLAPGSEDDSDEDAAVGATPPATERDASAKSGSDAKDQPQQQGRRKKEAWQRLDEARDIANALLEQVRELAPLAPAATDDGMSETTSQRSDGASTPGAAGSRQPGWKVPADVRQRRLAQVMGLLERESALVDAARERLERLSLMAKA